MRTENVLPRWCEIVGTIEDVDEGLVRISLKKSAEIPLQDDEIERWRHLLKKGSRMGILLLDDGTIRVRRITPGAGCPEKGD